MPHPSSSSAALWLSLRLEASRYDSTSLSMLTHLFMSISGWMLWSYISILYNTSFAVPYVIPATLALLSNTYPVCKLRLHLNVPRPTFVLSFFGFLRSNATLNYPPCTGVLTARSTSFPSTNRRCVRIAFGVPDGTTLRHDRWRVVTLLHHCDLLRQ